MKKDNFWSPYVAGAGLGLTLLATFFIMGKGLGASSAFSIAAAVASRKISPDYTTGLTYFARILSSPFPLKDWIVFEIAGLFVGALTGAVLAGTFRVHFDKGSHLGTASRVLTALTGGMLIGFAGRLARGCTSGVALSGGAQLAVAGWIFVISMFAAGFIGAAFLRRLWR